MGRYSPVGPAHRQEPLCGHGEGGADGAVVRDLHQRVQRRHSPGQHRVAVAEQIWIFPTYYIV